MKITLTFLLLGSCLALTNGFILNKKKKMSEPEAFSHGRMMSLVMKRWSDLKGCHWCRDIDRYCMERAMVEDTCFILRMMINDMGCTLQQLLGKVQFKFQVTIIYKAVEQDDIETLLKTLRAYGLIDHFLQTVCSVLNAPLKASNVELVVVFGVVNQVMGGSLNIAFGLLDGFIGGILNGLVGGAVHAVSGVVNAATGILGGLTNAATGVVGGLTNAATGVVGGLTNAATGVAGGVVNTAGGMVGGFLGGKNGLLG